MRSIASFSSLSYSNTFEESTSHTMDLVTITELYTMDKHCPEILGIPEEEVNTEMLSLEDDEILEGFLSDEADSPIATLPPLSGEAAEGSVKRSLIDEFSSTQGCRKVKQHRVKVEKID
nr:putative transposase [Ipomoea trifida]